MELSPRFHAEIVLPIHERLSRVRFSVNGDAIISAEIYSGKRFSS